jgi:hypothetical protein
VSGGGLLALTGALAASVLLLAAGVAHVRRPGLLAAHLAAHAAPRGSAGGGAPPAAALALGVFELGTGTAGVVAAGLGARTPVVAVLGVQTVLYAAFAAHLLRVLAAGGGGLPCGCGLPEVPVGQGAAARAAGLGLLSATGAAWAAIAWQSPLDADAGSVLLLVVAAPTLALLLAVVQPARRLPGTAATAARPLPSPRVGGTR